MEEILASSTEVAEGVDTSIALVNLIKTELQRLPNGSQVSHSVRYRGHSSRAADTKRRSEGNYEHAISHGEF